MTANDWIRTHDSGRTLRNSLCRTLELTCGIDPGTKATFEAGLIVDLAEGEKQVEAKNALLLPINFISRIQIKENQIFRVL